MRKLLTLGVFTAIAVFLAAAAVSAVTITQWASSPITVGDKLFTLISTTWAGGGTVTAQNYGGLYAWSLSPGSDKQITSTTKTMIYKVEIVDDPATTPLNELLMMYFSRVSGDGNRYIASGTFTVTGVFDDSSDFSSPLATFSNSGTPWGPSYVTPVVGVAKVLYVKLTFVASGGSTILSSYSVTFTQLQASVPTESTSWGNIKALYE